MESTQVIYNVETTFCVWSKILFAPLLLVNDLTGPWPTDLGEGGAEFAPTLSAGPSDDGGRDFEPRLETYITYSPLHTYRHYILVPPILYLCPETIVKCAHITLKNIYIFGTLYCINTPKRTNTYNMLSLSKTLTQYIFLSQRQHLCP